MNEQLTRTQYLLHELAQSLSRSLLLTHAMIVHGGETKEAGYRVTYAKRLELELTDADAVRGMLQRANVLDRTWPKDHEAATFDKRQRCEKAMKDRGIAE